MNEWERKEKQDVVINLEIQFDGQKVAATDAIADAINYKSLTKKVIQMVEFSKFLLLEKLADQILKLVMSESGALKATVEVDKPQALRFADSVSVQCSAEKASGS